MPMSSLITLDKTRKSRYPNEIERCIASAGARPETNRSRTRKPEPVVSLMRSKAVSG